MNENKTNSPVKICKMFRKNCGLRLKFQMKAKYLSYETNKQKTATKQQMEQERMHTNFFMKCMYFLKYSSEQHTYQTRTVFLKDCMEISVNNKTLKPAV